MTAWHRLEDPIYEDNGCRYSPSCLDCSLPKCYEDMDAEERRRLRQRVRDMKTWAAWERLRADRPGMGKDAALDAVGMGAGVTGRSVRRAFERLGKAVV